MTLLKSSGVEAMVVTLVSFRDYVSAGRRAQWQQTKTELSQFGLRIFRLPSSPNYLDRLVKTETLVILLLKIMRLRYRGRKIILHCRGAGTALMALNAKDLVGGISVVCDYRGVRADETLLLSGYDSLAGAPDALRQAYHRTEALDAEALTRADAILAVSHQMQRHVSLKWKIPRDKIHVIPCCTNVAEKVEQSRKRGAIRRELGIQERFAVCYSGSLERWQRFDRCAQFFVQVSSLIADAVLLVLTNEPERARKLLDHAGIGADKAIVKRLDDSEMGQYVSAGDLGFLVRDENAVNRVASPVKFAEYLAAGVPVLISRCLGDYSEFVEKHGVGVVVGNPGGCGIGDEARKFIAKYIEDPGPIRENCQRVASEFDWSAHLATFHKVYESV